MTDQAPEPLRDALKAFLLAYGSQDSFTDGLDKAATLARAALTRPPSERPEAQVREDWIDQNYQIDRYGMALMMIREGCADPSGLARRILSEFEQPRTWRDALAPFVEIAKHIDPKSRDSRPLVFGIEHHFAAQLTIGDIRSLVALAIPHEEPGQETIQADSIASEKVCDHPSTEKAGWLLLPRTLTAENGAKAALIGEFNEYFVFRYSDSKECEFEVPVTWTTIKAIWKAAVAHFEAAPPDESGDRKPSELARK